jgi:hypothetical protein
MEIQLECLASCAYVAFTVRARAIPKGGLVMHNELCGRGCGHRFEPGETRLMSLNDGDVCTSCVTREDLMSSRPCRNDDPEIQDAIAGHP